MHRRFFTVITVITIILLANIVNVAFSSSLLNKTKRVSDFQADKDSKLSTQYNANFHSSSEKARYRKPETNLWNLLGLDSPYKNSRSDEIGKRSDFACVDEDSAELVIGLNNAEPNAYNTLVKEINRNRGEIVNTVSIKDKVIAVVADIPLNAISSFTEKVQTSNLTRYIEPNMRFQAQFVPNDYYWIMQWGPRKIEADYAWNTTLGNSSVLVAVIDTGIDWNHMDLADNYIPLGYDWVNDDDDPMDDHGHGTHCAGIIAAIINNSRGVAGLAQVSIMAEKGLDQYGGGWADDLAKAIIHAVNQSADILSNSWGGYFDSALIHDAVQYAYDNGVIVVAAAGNEAWSNKLYPAAYDEVIAVTATDRYDNPASFTNFGDWVEVAAPGVDIWSTIWDDDYGLMSGTSMACPHVSGVAALILSQFPNATRDWVRAKLRYTAVDLGDPGFDEYYGYGRINASKAVEPPPDHDVLIFKLEKPTYIQPKDIVSFNVTVLNFGVNDEGNVTVQLLVDGNLTDSAVIDDLANGTSTTVSLSWNPLEERTYNVTFYVVPVAGETAIENNILTVMIPVRTIVGFVLFDQTHYCYPFNYFSMWVANLTESGYAVDTYTGGDITPDVLEDYDIFVIPEAWISYTFDEISAIQDFVLSGGGLLVTGDYDPLIYTSLTSFAGITWSTEYYGWSGYTSDITLHDVTEGVTSAYFGAPLSQLYVDSPAIDLIRDGWGYGEIMLVASEIGAGRVIAIADEDTVNNYGIVHADNVILANNMINWLLGVKYQHELVVRLDAPSYLEPGKTSVLNATVYNRGLNNETDVELQLFINGSLVKNESIPLLVNGTKYKMNHTWTPSTEGVYNVTVYAPPVPNENVTSNNMYTKFVKVQYPLINPIPGQYANYVLEVYDTSGYLIGTGYWNFTYDYYVEPYKIYVSMWIQDPYGYINMFWSIVNTMNRLVESGMWAGWWYPGWIETDIDIGSTINLLQGTATVNGSKILLVGARAIDCWELSYSEYGYQYTFWYDKASGLWIGMEFVDPYYGSQKLLLTDTNVPIGTHYEHDLGVTIETPQRLQPGETALLNATVYNLGLSNETDVEIQILINGTEVASETLDTLVNGTWHTINYSWVPTEEGIYNITAYTPPLLSENVTINNIATEMVDVRYIEVALISDYSELMVVAPILDSMGIGYDIYNNNYMYLYTEDLDLLLNYKAVIFYTSYRWITATEYSTLETYLSLGGNLLVTGFDCLVSDQLLASLVRSSSTGDNVGESDLYVVEETHPIMNGPYGSFPAGYHIYGLYSDCDMAEADTTQNAITVAELYDGYDRIIATEGLPGKVVFWNGRGTEDWTWNSDCEAMFKNLIHWFTVQYQHELVVFLETPSFLEPSDSIMLNATVQNQGVNNETNVKLQLLINSSIVENVTIPELLSGESYTINYLWTPTFAGIYNITVYAPPVSGENITRNNLYSRLVPVQYAPRILAYVEYTDYYQDYPNTLKAIESTFGPTYILTELRDYTQLDSMLDGKDILLIPDQEAADLYTMEMIGAAWSETLTEFLEKGGIIILCDARWGYGGTYGILTGAELMSISYANYRSYYTLYLTDPSDPLAEGVSSSFYAPYYTVSFVTEGTNVVVDDGVYPVVIHKEVGEGHIMLLGFDFQSSNTDTEQILGNAVALASFITVSVSPSAGSPGTQVTVTGTKATAGGTVSIYWDGMLAGNTTADTVGNFTYLFTVPSNATVGVHEIMAVDTTTGRTASEPFRVIVIYINPAEGPVGTKVIVNGAGFSPESQVTVTFNDMLMGYAAIDKFGDFTFTFNIPLAVADTYYIKAVDAEGNHAFAAFSVIDVTPLNVQVDVGAFYFLGEIAEFYAQTTFKGQAVNATTLDAVLYKPDGTTEVLTPQQVTTGLYKIPYTILGNQTGTYTLVITASYGTGTVKANGTSFKSFLVSDTFSLMNNQIVEIREGIAIVKKDLAFVKLNLTAMNATLENIFLKVIAINGTTATIQTTIGVVEGTITGTVVGDIATIVVPGLGEIKTDISDLKGIQGTRALSQYVIIIIALIAATSATLSAIFLNRRKTAKPK